MTQNQFNALAANNKTAKETVQAYRTLAYRRVPTIIYKYASTAPD